MGSPGTPSPSFVLLDGDYALHLAGGDSALLGRVCHAFLESLPLCMEDLAAALGSRNLRRAGRALLPLQSYLAAFGFGHGSCTAVQLEYAIQNRRLRQARRHWRRLRRQVRILAPQVEFLMLELYVPSGKVH